MRLCGGGRACVRLHVSKRPHRANLRKSEQLRSTVFPPFGRGKQSACPTLSDRRRRKTGEFAGRSPHPLLPTASKNSNKEVQLTSSNKDIRISFRVSEAEYQQIEAKANKAGMSISAYVRTASLRHRITVVDGLKDFTAQLKGIGRNLNQLATLANMGRIQTVGLDDVLESLRKIYDQLTRLVGREER